MEDQEIINDIKTALGIDFLTQEEEELYREIYILGMLKKSELTIKNLSRTLGPGATASAFMDIYFKDINNNLQK